MKHISIYPRVYGQVRLPPEVHEVALFTLPLGWEELSDDEMNRWMVGEAIRRGKVARPLEPTDNGCPSGEWEVGRIPTQARWEELHAELLALPSHSKPDHEVDGFHHKAAPRNYHDHENAARQVAWVDGEAYQMEQPVVTVDEYPSSWDKPIAVTESGRLDTHEVERRTAGGNYESRKDEIRRRMED